MKTLQRAAPPDPDRAAGVGPVPLALLVIALGALVGALRIVISMHRPFLSGGDAAFMELAVRRALQGRQLLGPYSRFGWNHPGPSVFYLFAPTYWLSGSSSRSLFLSSWLVNVGSAMAVVALVRHRLGEAVARLTAGIVVTFLIATGFGTLINPWNPALLALPFLLMVFLGADAATGSAWSLIGGLVVGSYLVQTHVGMLPVAGLTLLGSTGAWGMATFRRERRPAGPLPWRAFAAGGLVLGLIWAGPVADQLAHSPGNPRKILSFFRHPPSDFVHRHSVPDTLAAVSNEATRPVLGAPATRLSARRAGVLVAAGILGAGVAILARKRSRFAAMLGALGAVNPLLTVLVSTRVVGDLEPYLFVWTPALLLPPVAAAGLLALDGAPRWAGAPIMAALARLGVAALVVVAALFARSTIRHATISFTDSPDAMPAAKLIEANVDHDRHRVFQIHVLDGHFETSALLLALVRDGYQFRMTAPYGLYTGSTDRRPQAGLPVVVVGTTASPTLPSAIPLGTVGPFVFTTVKA